jgi:hypothetical protein
VAKRNKFGPGQLPVRLDMGKEVLADLPGRACQQHSHQ